MQLNIYGSIDKQTRVISAEQLQESSVMLNSPEIEDCLQGSTVKIFIIERE
jgi:hypothetical protein